MEHSLFEVCVNMSWFGQFYAAHSVAAAVLGWGETFKCAGELYCQCGFQCVEDHVLLTRRVCKEPRWFKDRWCFKLRKWCAQRCSWETVAGVRSNRHVHICIQTTCENEKWFFFGTRAWLDCRSAYRKNVSNLEPSNGATVFAPWFRFHIPREPCCKTRQKLAGTRMSTYQIPSTFRETTHKFLSWRLPRFLPGEYVGSQRHLDLYNLCTSTGDPVVMTTLNEETSEQCNFICLCSLIYRAQLTEIGICAEQLWFSAEQSADSTGLLIQSFCASGHQINCLIWKSRAQTQNSACQCRFLFVHQHTM